MIIKRPIVTESAYAGESFGKYYFWVDLNATKTEIAAEFQKVFKVKPTSVNTSTVRGKIKTNWKTRLSSQKGTQKKAIITVPKGTKLESLSLTKASKK